MFEFLFGRRKPSPQGCPQKAPVKPAFEALERRELMNGTPIITPPSTPYSHEGDSGTLLSIVASDSDGDALTYTVTGLPAGLSINASLGTVEGTVGYGNASLGSVANFYPTVTVTDGGTGTATAGFMWCVSDVPLAAYHSLGANEGSSVSLYAGPSTIPSGVTYSASSLPTGISVDPTSGLISGRPAYSINNPAPTGSTNLSATVTAAYGSVTDIGTVAFAISDTDRLPTQGWSAYGYSGGQGVSISFAATDLIGNALTYTQSNLPSGLSINSSGLITGTVAYDAVSSGVGYITATITLTDDHGGTDYRSISWAITDVPLFGWSSAWYGTEGQSLSLAVGNPTLTGVTYTSSNLPSWLTLDATTGLVSGWMQYTPNNPTGSGYASTMLPVSVTATVPGAGSATEIAPLYVSDFNRLPSSSYLYATEGVSVTWSMAAHNPSGGVPVSDALTYSASGLPTGVTIDAATGLIGGAPDYSVASSGSMAYLTATVTVRDQWGGIDSQTQYLYVSDSPLAGYRYLSTNEGNSVSFYAGPTAAPSGANYTQTGLPTGLTLNSATGLISGRPAYSLNNPSPSGSTYGYATVTAVLGSTADTGTIAYMISDVDRLPTQGWSAYSYAEGQGVSIPFAATDSIGNALTYTQSNLPSGLSINGSGLIAGTVAYNAVSSGVGYITATITLTDDHGGTDYRSISWAITDVPLFGWSSAWYGTEGQSLSLAVGNPTLTGVTYTSSNLPSWLTLDATTGLVSGWMQYTPNNPTGSGYASTMLPVSVTATVPGAGSATEIAPLYVSDFNRLPSSSYLYATEGVSVTWSMAAHGPSGGAPVSDALTYSASGLPTGVTIDAATGLIGGAPDYSVASSGSMAYLTATVTVRDQWGGIDSQTQYLYVSDSPLAGYRYLSTNEGNSVSFYAGPTAAPSGANYTQTGLPTGLTLNASTGLVSGRPVYSLNNPSPSGSTYGYATVTATYDSATDIGTVAFAISDTDRLPTQGWSAYGYSEGQGVSIPFAATDLIGNALTYTQSNLPSGLSINSLGLITGTVAYNAVSSGVGYITATLTLTDDHGGTDYRSISWAITDVPLFGWSSAWYGTEGQTMSLALGNPTLTGVTYTSSNLPPWLSLNASTGLMSGWMQYVANNPTGSGYTSTTINVSVTASVAGAGSNTEIAPLVASDFNRLPSSSFDAVYEGDTLAWNMAVASNPTGDTLAYSASGLPFGVTIDRATGMIGGVPDYAIAPPGGTASVTATVTVQDQWGGTDSRTQVFYVSDTPSAYFATGRASVSESAGTETVTVDLTAATGRTVTVQYATSDGTAVAGIDYTATSGTLTFTPGTTSQTFTVPILDAVWTRGTTSLSLSLSNPVHATEGDGNAETVTIVSDKHPPVAHDDPTGAAAAWWKFDENTGTTSTDQMTGAVATLPASGVSWSSSTPSALGSGSSLLFASAAGPVTTDALNLGTGDFTAALWIKWTTVGDAQLIGQDDGSGNSWSLSETGGVLTFSVSNAGTVTTPVSASWSPTDGAWHEVAVTRSGTSWTLYVDGTSVASATSSVAMPSLGALPLSIGSTTLAANLDDLRMFRSALSGSDVSALDAGTYTPATPISVTGDTAQSIAASTLLSNDTDADGHTLTIIGWTPPNHGTLSFDGTYFTYIPTTYYHGPDAFSYTVSDGLGGTSSAWVYLSVSAVHHAPTANGDAATTDVNTATTINVLANDIDQDGNALTVSLASGYTGYVSAAHGSTALSGNQIVYTPSTDYVGPDSFTYQISDGVGGTAYATVNVEVGNGQWATSVISASSTWNDAPYDWLPLQALGTPNTSTYGDNGTAWAPMEEGATATASTDTLALGFKTADYASGILVRETYGNGFVTQIDLQDSTGAWHNAVWTGTDSTPTGAPGNFVATWSPTSYLVEGARITVGLRANATAWDEIDAVKLLDATATSSVTTAPSAANISISVDEDTSVTFSPWSSVTNTGGTPLILSFPAAPANGTAEINYNNTPEDPSDDSIVYTPNAEYRGSDSFTYEVTDIWGQTSTGTVTVTVNPVNDLPTLNDATVYYSAVKNTPLAINLAAGAADVDGDSLTVSAAGNGAHGTTSISGGTVTYTPASGYVGPDSFTYTISDGNGGTVSGTAVVTTYETGEWASGVLSYSSQYDTSDNAASQALGAPDVFAYGDDPSAWAPANEGSNSAGNMENLALSFATPAQATGVVVRETDGAGFVVGVELKDTSGTWHTVWAGTDPSPANHAADFILTFPQTSYTVAAARITVDISRDPNDWAEIDAVRLLTGGSPSTTSVTTTAANQAPTAVDAWAETSQNSAVAVSVLANASDPEGDALSIVSGTYNNASHGSVSLYVGSTPSNSYLVYTPSSGYSGQDSFTYEISDGFGGTATATVHVQVGNGEWASAVGSVSSELAGTNPGDYRAMQALGAPNTPSYGQAPTAWAPANEDGSSESLSLLFPTAAYSNGVVVRETDGNGFITQIDLQDSGGTWHNAVWSGTDATPANQAADFVATWSATSYLVQGVRIHVNTDLAKGTYEQIDAVRLLTVSAPSEPSAPIAVGDSVSTPENRPILINALANDTLGGAVSLILGQPANGTVVIDEGGSPNNVSAEEIKYTPNADWSGTDSFTYTLTDAFGQTSTATVTIGVSAVNQPPVTTSDVAATTVGTAVTINVLAGDSDPDGDTLTLSSVAAGAHGTTSISSGQIVYTPASGYVGPDTFTYVVSDGNGGTATGTVDVIVYGAGQWASTTLGATSGTATAINATGAPTTGAPVSWSPDGGAQRESLTVGFASAAYATGLSISQSVGAGTLREVDLIESDGTPHAIWSGTDTSTASGPTDFVLRFPATSYQVASVRIVVDASSGQTDVDAVRLLTGGTFSALSVTRTDLAAAGQYQTTSYDSDGNAIQQSTYTDATLTQSTASTYSSGVLATQTVTDALGNETYTTYDSAGHVLTSTLAYGTSGAATTTYTYDGSGNETSETDPNGNETTWTYNALGQQTVMTDPNGHEVVKTYNGAGLVATELNRNSLLTTYAYDSSNRLITEMWYSGATTSASVAQTLTWTYDSNGNVTEASTTDGTNTYTYSYIYDSQNRVIQVTEPFGVTLTFGYDEYGNRNLVEDSLGGVERSIYNASGQLLERTLVQGSAVMRMDYTYNPSGQMATAMRYDDLAGSSLVATTDYSYDAQSRQTEIETTNSSATTLDSFSYAYNSASQLTSQTNYQPGISGTPQTTTYSYDAQGELTQAGSTTYGYDANGNRNTTGYTTGTNNQLTSNGTWNYSYDAEGNLVEKDKIGSSEKWTYTYDNANQLTVVKQMTDGTDVDLEEDFKYDVYGNRIESVLYPAGAGTTTPTVTKYELDGWDSAKGTPVGNENWDVWGDLDGSSSLTTRYFQGDAVDQLFGRIQSGSVYWHLTDSLGSVREVIGPSGVSSINYDAYGNILADSSARGRYGFTGREYDAEIDLQYNRARYYDSETGRWISQDPMGFAAGDSNLYRYVSNKVAEATDPSGRRVLVVSFEGTSQVSNPALGGWNLESRYIDTLVPLEKKGDVSLLKFVQARGTVVGIAKNTEKRILQQVKAANADGSFARLVLLGWSWGAQAVINMAGMLTAEKVRIDAAFTIDPITQPIPNRQGDVNAKNYAADAWYNYYQKQSVLLTGYEIANATNAMNQEVSAAEFKNAGLDQLLGNYHVDILRIPRIEKQWADTILGLIKLGNRANWGP